MLFLNALSVNQSWNDHLSPVRGKKNKVLQFVVNSFDTIGVPDRVSGIGPGLWTGYYDII